MSFRFRYASPKFLNPSQVWLRFMNFVNSVTLSEIGFLGGISMPKEIKLWQINSNDMLKQINVSKLNLEDRIENWLEKDISMISENLLVIGRQVKTAYGKYIDLLCLNDEGDIIIVELKRDKTPRDVTAQILDYASWIGELSNKEVTDIANDYFYKYDTNLEEAFQNKFDKDLPEVLNESHKMLVVASEMDNSTERIINYLSDEYGVGINVVTFQYFKDEKGNEFIGRIFLIEPEQVDYNVKTKSGSKRRSPLTYEELKREAERNEVLELYQELINGFEICFDFKGTTLSSITFIGKLDESNKTMIGIYPKKSSKEEGIYLDLYITRIAKYFGVQKQDILDKLPPRIKDKEPEEAWSGGPPKLTGYFKNLDEINEFVNYLRSFVSKANFR